MKTVANFLEPYVSEYVLGHQSVAEQFQWRLWHRFSEVQKMHEQVSTHRTLLVVLLNIHTVYHTSLFALARAKTQRPP